MACSLCERCGVLRGLDLPRERVNRHGWCTTHMEDHSSPELNQQLHFSAPGSGESPSSQVCGDDPFRASRSPERPGASGGGSPGTDDLGGLSFTCSTDTCCGAGEGGGEQQLAHEGFELRGRRCRSAGCPRCGPQKAYRLARRLEAELERFKNPQLWTLTIDPKACPDPRRIYYHLKRVRAAGELVRTLFNAGYLEQRDYFCAVEFQMGDRRADGGATEQVHLHIIMDAKGTREHPGGFIPHGAVQERWNKFLPTWAVEQDGWRANRLGKVQFEKVDNRKGMAIYATKYIAKGSKEGLPEWFIAMIDQQDRRCTLSSHSRGFWKVSERKAKPAVAVPSPTQGTVAIVDAVLARAKSVSPGRKASVRSRPAGTLEKPRRSLKERPRPFRERLKRCGTQVDFYFTQTFRVLGGMKTRPHFQETVPVAFDEVAALMHVSEQEERRRVIPLSPGRMQTFREFIKTRESEIYRVDMRRNPGGWDDGIPGKRERVPQAGCGPGVLAGRGSAQAGQVASLDDQRSHSTVAEKARTGAACKRKSWEAIGEGGTQVRRTYWYQGRGSSGDDDDCG